MAIYMWRERVPKTFTIQWEEKSDMSSGWTYSDDAAGLTAGDTAFDEFFGYSGVRLSTAGVETAEITQGDSGGNGKLDITQLGTLTSGDNVMIKFPVRGIKMTKSGSIVTLSITDGLGRESEGYQYYAFCTGTLSSPGTPKDAFYVGAYEGYINSSVLKSWSGKSPTVSQRQATFCTQAKANGSGYNIIGFYQGQYINALYMMKYGNPNSQSVVGKGYTGGSSRANTGGTNSQTNATYGTSSATTQCKLFGVEDRWGNLTEFEGGVYTNGSKKLYTLLTGWTGSLSGGEDTGSVINTTTSNNLASISGNNKAMFTTIGTVYNTSYSTYYCDSVGAIASMLGGGRGAWDSGSACGALGWSTVFATNFKDVYTGSRLMYLDGLS